MMHPKSFKTLIIDNAVGLLWDQWVNLGAWSKPGQSAKVFSDPECAIAFSRYFCKHEKRLEKISLDWSKANLQYINHSRLKRLRKAVVDHIQLPVDISEVHAATTSSKYITEPDASDISNLLIRLRLLFGSTTRAEIMFHLLTMGRANSNQIAVHRFLNQKAVLLELEKLAKAGVLVEKRLARERLFSVQRNFAGLFESEIQSISPPWFLLASLSMLEECFTDDLIEDEYLVISTFMDHKRKLSYYLQKAGECNLTLSGPTAYEFYESVTEYYTGLCTLF
jgi:hypothetical protein